MPKFKVLTGGKKPTPEEAIARLLKLNAELCESVDDLRAMSVRSSVRLLVLSRGVRPTIEYLQQEISLLEELETVT